MLLMRHKNHKQIHSLNYCVNVSLSQGCECSSDHSGRGQVQHSPPSPGTRLRQSPASVLRVGLRLVLSPVFYFEKNYQNHATTASFVCQSSCTGNDAGSSWIDRSESP